MTSSRWQRNGPALIGVLGLMLLGALYCLRAEEPRPTSAESQREAPAVVAVPVRPPALEPAVDAAHAHPFVDERPVAQTERAPRHAHPNTFEHARLYRDVDLLEDVKRALAKRDFATARAILAQHRVEFPNGYPERVEGYEIIADCLENPGPETTARAQRYHDEKRASIVRRQVRKACLTPPS